MFASLAGRTVVVTGAGKGIGRGIAEGFAALGATVVLQDVLRTELDEAASAVKAQGARAHTVWGDLAKSGIASEDFSQALSVAGRVDFLVNNAGMGATVPFEQVTEELFTDFLNVHFKGIFFLTQKFVPMINSGGRIINISTGTTRFSNPGYSVYASMKGAIEVFTKYLAKELGPKGIGANVVAPGPIETDFNSATIRNNPEMKNRLSLLSPLGRVGNADDIGSVVAFLCTDDAKWINGQRIEVSGGINV